MHTNKQKSLKIHVTVNDNCVYMKKSLQILLLPLFILAGCDQKPNASRNVPLKEIAGNEKVKSYMEAFEGRGDQSDNSKLTPPKQALENFQFADDLELDLLLSEPQVHQPVELSFDHRGRLWVVQYNQYPYPEGVKVVDIDHHNRAVFDKVPLPPSEGVKGADKITIFEDTNNDGIYDKSTDAITGLNIATSVTLGRGKIWVLTPPYLVAYPDPNGDGIPDGKPEVHLEGFGLEDTHAVANSLRWGPDGWLYGAQGSTTHATINSGASKNVHFKGQAIWRYHPESKVFEIFAEGGGNTFHVEIDAKGRIYSGDNGNSRGFFYKQGGYYHKNWGKHGALTNPYALGYLPAMELEGEVKRFTHGWVKYEGASLPEKYHDKIIAINPLHNFVQLTRLEQRGSTFLNVDEEKILKTKDHWFRPVDIKVGPDGGIYLADWYDSRLSHIDPRDTWNKNTGRIYRLRNKTNTKVKSFDLSTYSNQQLIELLSHENKWFRQQALRQFGDRKDKSIVHELTKLFRTGDAQTTLEALWAINLSGGFNDKMALEALNHADPFVRLWAVRLIGDDNKVSSTVSKKLVELASADTHLEVLGQLASTAKRVPGSVAIPIIENLLRNDATVNDPDNQMLIWWAMESKAETDRSALLALFKQSDLWDQAIVTEIILDRLMQRYTLAGGKQNYASCVVLFELVPSEKHAKKLLNGLQEGLAASDVSTLPDDLAQFMQHYQTKFGEGRLALSLYRNEAEAVDQALELLVDENADRLERMSYIQIFGKVDQPKSIPILLKVAEDHKYSTGIRMACLQALRHYSDKIIGEKMAEAYPHRLRANMDLRNEAFRLFASRASWANEFLLRIYKTREVKKDEIPLTIVRQFKLLNDSSLVKRVDGMWPNVRIASSDEKNAEILRIKQALKTGSGDITAGKSVYTANCASCHRLFDEGGSIGPDLTGYDRTNLTYLALNIVDPNADIREGYVNYRIVKKDGQVLVGTMTDRSGGNITIKPIGNEEITLSSDEIEEMEAQKISIMSERLMESMTDKQIRDLFAYLGK